MPYQFELDEEYDATQAITLEEITTTLKTESPHCTVNVCNDIQNTGWSDDERGCHVTLPVYARVRGAGGYYEGVETYEDDDDTMHVSVCEIVRAMKQDEIANLMPHPNSNDHRTCGFVAWRYTLNRHQVGLLETRPPTYYMRRED